MTTWTWKGYEEAVAALIDRLADAEPHELRSLHAEADALLERYVREMAVHHQPEAIELVLLLDDERLYLT